MLAGRGLTSRGAIGALLARGLSSSGERGSCTFFPTIRGEKEEGTLLPASPDREKGGEGSPRPLVSGGEEKRTEKGGQYCYEHFRRVSLFRSSRFPLEGSTVASAAARRMHGKK